MTVRVLLADDDAGIYVAGEATEVRL